jgi:predicted aldo/keto reductase-like oxidoreductase
MELSKIVIGGMRVADRTSGVATFRAAIDAGFNYIDTSPGYCRQSEEENSEAWVGEAIADPAYRSRVMISTKCSPGDGGLGLGEFNAGGGFGVRSTTELKEVFEQSLRRMGLDRVDFYHLWTTHTDEQFAEAMKPEGWYDGVVAQREKWDHLGVTTHGDTDTIIRFLETGKFEMVTIPLNVINTMRLPVVDYCRQRGIKVIAMNPLAGGFLAARDDLKEMALRYLMLLDGVHPLIGFSSPEEVAYAKWIQDTMSDYPLSAEEIVAKINTMMDTHEPRCTSCGYCSPCPQNITVGAALSYYNAVKYLHMEEAGEAFRNKQWKTGLRLDLCTGCGECEKRCPNSLPVRKLIEEARALLYRE